MTTDTPARPAYPALDFTRLTLGEVAKLEELSGLSLDRIGDADAPKGKLLAAMAFVASRRHGEPITWPEALELTVDAVNDLLGLTDLAGDDDGAEDAEGEEDADPNR